jgi:hypothetical protein
MRVETIECFAKDAAAMATARVEAELAAVDD